MDFDACLFMFRIDNIQLIKEISISIVEVIWNILFYSPLKKKRNSFIFPCIAQI